MLSNSRILAQTTLGKNTVILSQVDSTYVLILAATVTSVFTRKTSLKVLNQKVLSREEALLALEHIHAVSKSKETINKTLFLGTSATVFETGTSILLLETSTKVTVEAPRVTHASHTPSPYYGKLEIFLTSQMTCAPNMF